MTLEGIITAMVTPFDKEGSICEASTKKLINHLIDSGVNGLFILGTNGEFFSLNDEEKVKFAKLVVEEVRGRIPVYAGAGGISTQGTIDLVNELEKVKVDAVSIITPYLISLTDEEIYRHYEQILKHTNCPIILYNIPQNTHINLSENVVNKLAKFIKVIGIKDSSGNLENLSTYLKIAEKHEFSVLIGSDSLILEALKRGASGAVAATSNLLPRTDIAIYQSFKENKFELAQQYQDSINDYRAINKIGSVPAMLKKALNFTGINVGSPRLPVLPISSKYDDELRIILEKYKKIEKFGEEKNAKA
ncbi:4-hydroxy-tetrahydrodipicolinate synthase [Candidatus Enterococcus willemsii]|uniref:4-hydroxy-tetrahydrodipicolinate synthase n=1 Tax=Candidatus Enterococcus willemsii TaxID=1857215 RepID=A0ABQ6Z188_9ENTE|nr:4-hydroxy-tetrahydrodipicolinate synthase [Enterococcus sp. CU12B]KAF1305137.1 4-hydroxy-tetrahydrodipicolinate synthase [Enterococcus sp. CU12B]